MEGNLRWQILNDLPSIPAKDQQQTACQSCSATPPTQQVTVVYEPTSGRRVHVDLCLPHQALTYRVPRALESPQAYCLPTGNGENPGHGAKEPIKTRAGGDGTVYGTLYSCIKPSFILIRV
ncbi:Hypothetical predicted protein [Pelobates cultripes]|uniref:Uncharacterized protein n=1 Tax=Pelobates cultripes TaxID=61616 RepID=A0AAD1WM77_PELCU|nr:Hypothetical predicted protein [Pelobates cultripes]